MHMLVLEFCSFLLIIPSPMQESKRLAQAQSVLPNGDVKVKAEH